MTASQTQPGDEPTATTAGPGVSDPVTKSLPGVNVGGTEVDQGDTVPARQSNRLGETGDGTRRLIILGGIALLVGAVIVAFTGQDEAVVVAAASPPIPGASRQRRTIRRGRPDWASGVPLAPGKREQARRKAGISAWSYLDGEPGA